MTTNPVRPKVVAAGTSTVAATTLALALRFAGVDVDEIPAEALILGGGAIATLAALVKKDGLRGAWERLVDGQREYPMTNAPTEN